MEQEPWQARCQTLTPVSKNLSAECAAGALRASHVQRGSGSGFLRTSPPGGPSPKGTGCYREKVAHFLSHQPVQSTEAHAFCSGARQH